MNKSKKISDKLQAQLAELKKQLEVPGVDATDILAGAFWLGASSITTGRSRGVRRISNEEREEQNKEYDLEEQRIRIKDLAASLFPHVVIYQTDRDYNNAAITAVLAAMSLEEAVYKFVLTGRKRIW